MTLLYRQAGFTRKGAGFRVEKGCDGAKLSALCEERGLNEREARLLSRKYVYCDSDVKLQRDFNLTNIRREIHRIRDKYGIE